MSLLLTTIVSRLRTGSLASGRHGPEPSEQQDVLSNYQPSRNSSPHHPSTVIMVLPPSSTSPGSPALWFASSKPPRRLSRIQQSCQHRSLPSAAHTSGKTSAIVLHPTPCSLSTVHVHHLSGSVFAPRLQAAHLTRPQCILCRCCQIGLDRH